MAAADGSILRILEEDRDRYYEELLSAARAQAQSEGCTVETSLVSDDVVEAIADFVTSSGVQLLVVALHHRELPIARMGVTPTQSHSRSTATSWESTNAKEGPNSGSHPQCRHHADSQHQWLLEKLE
jgi:hypothetical protein